MSTMLVIPDEIEHRGTIHHESWMRSIPEQAVWWRMRLWPNEEYQMSIFQLQIDNLDWLGDGSANGHHPWSMRVELFDNSDKWFFPYDYTFAVQREAEKPYPEYPHTILTKSRTYLDILAVEPPGPVEVGWAVVAQKHAWTRLTSADRWDREWPEHPTDRFYEYNRMP